MLDSTFSRAVVTSRVRALTTTAALAVVCPLASLRVDAPVRLTQTPVTSASTPQPVRVSAIHDVRAAVSARPAPKRLKASPSQVAVVESPARQPLTRPDFSGKWTPDTASTLATSVVNDSTIIAQSADAISFDSRGRNQQDERTYASVHNIAFDGVPAIGVFSTGDVGAKLSMSAVWAGDTLVMTSYAIGYVRGGIHDALSTQRFTLGSDGNTLIETAVSYSDGRLQWSEPKTFVLRRLTR